MSQIYVDGTTNLSTYSAMSEGTRLNNAALFASNSGNLVQAEHLHKEAIKVKEAGLGNNHTSTAISYNALGEVYIKLKRLDEAEDYLKRALAVRGEDGPTLDAAVTRDNLGRVYEMKGDFAKANQIRRRSDKTKMVCSNYDCPKANELFRFNQLRKCSRCQCVYYCSQACQRVDWARHKEYCKTL
ncbi:hypothetical protein K474DRAFT_1666980 [Panus rudis PR-1116 ss-1]|nr:hypothetical protein K474DRAFT_1666980 [Panus rudis PR-1116 ss-1]